MTDGPDFVPLIGYDNRKNIDDTFQDVDAAQARINALESALAALHAFTENHFRFGVKPVGADALLAKTHNTLYGPYTRKGEREAEKAAERAKYEEQRSENTHLSPDPFLVKVNKKLAKHGHPTLAEYWVGDDF